MFGVKVNEKMWLKNIDDFMPAFPKDGNEGEHSSYFIKYSENGNHYSKSSRIFLI